MLPLMCKRSTFANVSEQVCERVNHLWRLQTSHTMFANILVIMQTWVCIWLIVVVALWKNEWLCLGTDEIWEKGWDWVTFLQMLHVTFANLLWHVCKRHAFFAHERSTSEKYCVRFFLRILLPCYSCSCNSIPTSSSDLSENQNYQVCVMCDLNYK